MENSQIIERVKLLSDEQNDLVVEAYLDIAKEIILNKAFPFKDTFLMEVPIKYHSTLVNATVYLLNKRGAEGETTHDENGIKRVYTADDLPNSIMKSIVPMCKV